MMCPYCNVSYADGEACFCHPWLEVSATSAVHPGARQEQQDAIPVRGASPARLRKSAARAQRRTSRNTTMVPAEAAIIVALPKTSFVRRRI